MRKRRRVRLRISDWHAVPALLQPTTSITSTTCVFVDGVAAASTDSIEAGTFYEVFNNTVAASGFHTIEVFTLTPVATEPVGVTLRRVSAGGSGLEEIGGAEGICR